MLTLHLFSLTEVFHFLLDRSDCSVLRGRWSDRTSKKECGNSKKSPVVKGEERDVRISDSLETFFKNYAQRDE